eukprot:TRINITY_DN1224_c0_g1_i3.p1 TRINITY_DN1224_c0_g1~~TRINITY_DN1224_c0_g1_i3.p1  ORF type:complete len:274 (+),score=-0.91 TRINITY_DN1224_c0_g1_i3:99-824(+)
MIRNMVSFHLLKPLYGVIRQPSVFLNTKIITPQEEVETWNEFSEAYANLIEPCHTYVNNILATQTRVRKAKSILEVACGSGYGALSILPLIAKGATYYCTDFSPVMLKRLQERFISFGFTLNPKNNLRSTFSIPTTKISVTPSANEEGITVNALCANNEDLPFVESSFDSYLAPYSLYHVPHPEKMLQESFRVLKKNGIASFAVFGKQKDSPMFSVMPKILAKYAKKYSNWEIRPVREVDL